MKEYIATQGERLDQIIYREYKSLDKNVVNEVLKANPHLLTKLVLDAFDVVYLPEIEIKPSIEDKALW